LESRLGGELIGDGTPALLEFNDTSYLRPSYHSSSCVGSDVADDQSMAPHFEFRARQRTLPLLLVDVQLREFAATISLASLAAASAP
jgi:hypothetical protein